MPKQVDLCSVVRGAPVRSVLWVDSEDAWDVEGDLRLFATGVTGDAFSFTVASTLCDAIEACYRLRGEPSKVVEAVASLRREDGSEIDPSYRGAEPTRTPPHGAGRTATRGAASARSGRTKPVASSGQPQKRKSRREPKSNSDG